MIGTDALARAMVAYIVAVFGLGVGITLLVVFGVPWLWRLLKPLIHSVTG